MAGKYFYSRDGQTHGPFSSAELKKLASSGDLRPSDLVWKEGMAERRPAGSAKGLFEPRTPSREPAGDSASAGTPGIDVEAARDAVSRAASAAKRHVMTAARVAALSAERTKIEHVSLAFAYAQLGRRCYEARTDDPACAELVRELDELAAAIEATRSEAPLPTAATLGERARAAAGKGLQAAKAQKLAMQQKAAFVRLGKAAYASRGAGAGPDDLVQPVRDLLARKAELEESLTATAAAPTRRRMAIWGGVGLLGLAGTVLLAVPYMRGRGTPASTTERGPQAPVTVPNLPIPDFVADFRRRIPQVSPPPRPEFVPATESETPQAAVPAGEGPGAAPGQSREDPALVKIVLETARKEQEFHPERASVCALVPAPHRMQGPVRLIEKPLRRYETGWDRVNELQIDPEESLLLAACRPSLAEQVALRLPNLERCACDPSIDPVGATITYYRWADEQQRQYAEFERGNRARSLPAAYRATAEKAALLGPPAVFHAAGIATVNDTSAPLSGHGNAIPVPSIFFWNHDRGTIKLVDASPLKMADARADRANTCHAMQVAGCGDAVIMLVDLDGFSRGFGRGSSLQVWTKKGSVGSMQLTHRAGSTEHNALAMAVSERTKQVALLYPHAVRFVSVSKLTRPDMELDPDKVVAFDSGSQDSDDCSVRWTEDGTLVIVQRVSGEEGVSAGHKVSRVHVIDAKSGTEKAVFRSADVTGRILDIAPRGAMIAIAQRYVPFPGVSSSSLAPYEVHVLTLPDLKPVRTVHTCFARWGRFADSNRLITGGVANPDIQRNVQEQAGGFHATLWNLDTGMAEACIRDKSMDAMVMLRDGKRVVTAAEKAGEASAQVRMWDISAGAPRVAIDEFQQMRRRAIDELAEGDRIITEPAPPVERKVLDACSEGQSYPEIKRQCCGAGAFQVDFETRADRGVLKAVVDYEVAGTESGRYRLVFESPMVNVGTRVEGSLTLVRKEPVGAR